MGRAFCIQHKLSLGLGFYPCIPPPLCIIKVTSKCPKSSSFPQNPPLLPTCPHWQQKAGYFKLLCYSILWLGCIETSSPSVTVTWNVRVIPGSWDGSLAGHIGHKKEVSVKRGVCSTEQYYQLCASTGLPRCSGSPRQNTFLQTPATTKFFNSARSRVSHTRCRHRSYPEPIDKVFRWTLPAPTSVHRCCLCLCPPGHGALLLFFVNIC